MGWSFRKSSSLGPFRVSFSRAGIGLSFGVKGARVSVSKRGTYVNVGVNGFRYWQRLDSPANSPANHDITPPQDPSAYTSHTPLTISTGSVENVTDADSRAFVEELESKAGKRSFFKILGVWPSVFIVLFTLSYSNAVVQVDEHYADVFTISKGVVHIRRAPSKDSLSIRRTFIGEKYPLLSTDAGWVKIIIQRHPQQEGFVRADMGLISRELMGKTEIKRVERQPALKWAILILIVFLVFWCTYLKRLDRQRKTLEIYYSLDAEIETLHKKFLTYFKEFTYSRKIWQNLHAQRVDDTKYHAGASTLVSRVPIGGVSLHKLPSPFLKTNVSVPCITLKNTELYFFPERLIVKRGSKFGAIFYKNIDIACSNVRFIEDQTVPPDAITVDYTWKYLNKSGGPDRRFNGNRRLPICNYTEYTFTSDSGLYEVITTSKLCGMNNLANFLKLIGEFQQRLN